MNIEQQLFRDYATDQQAALELLKEFTLPAFQSWVIDWNLAYEISQRPGKKKQWHQVEQCNDMIMRRSYPAIYYFSCDEDDGESIHSAFVEHKKEKHNNLSFVPPEYNGGTCIYVGSRKDSVNGRMVQHLGITPQGGTGALYLHHVLQKLPVFPAITFHYAILDHRYRNVTKHIEAVVQDQLNPFIGKRAMEKLDFIL